MSSYTLINCPKCGWPPDENCIWICTDCKTRWNTFATHGRCPTCTKIYEDTQCIKLKGGCGQWSPHKDWYIKLKRKTTPSVFSFWKNQQEYPVTENDKAWIEHILAWLTHKLDLEYLTSLNTITPEELYSGHEFKGMENDANFLLKKIAHIIDLDVSQVRIMFFSEERIEVAEEDLIEASMEEMNNLENSKPEPNIIWMDSEWLTSPNGLTIILAHKLIRHKLFLKFGTREIDPRVVALSTIAFGFGIFMANFYFESFGNTYPKRWYTKTSWYLPIQVVAYAMAWSTHYRSEDRLIFWAHSANKPMHKYIEQSYQFIENNKDQVKWSIT